MVLWFVFTVGAVSLLGALVSFALALANRGPNDISLGAAALTTLLLLVQIVLAIVRPFFGDTPRGDGLEYWMYLLTATLMPPLAGFWALIDRSKWANVVLGVVQIAIAIMMWRMWVIWS